MENNLAATHASPRRAELAAAASVAPHLTHMKADIVSAITAAGEKGLTPDDFQLATGKIINTIRRRFTDLWKEGHIRPTNRTRPNARGFEETVWALGRDTTVQPSRETASQKIARLQRHIRLLVVEGQRLQGRLWHHAESPTTHKYSDNCGCESCAASRCFDNLVVEVA